MVKKLKDPNAPKRPTSAYFAWAADNRDKVIKTMPVGYSVGELGKAQGLAWKKVDEETKKKYQEEYEKKAETYKKLMNAYKQTTDYANFEKQKKEHKVQAVQKTKFRKDENAPKRPMTAYFLWMADNRATVAAKHVGEPAKVITKELGQMWKSVSDEDKKPYEEKAKAAKEEHAKALAKYKESEEYKTYQEEKAEFDKSRKTKLTKAKKRARGEDEWSPKKKAKRSKKSPKSKKKTKKPKAPKRSVKKASKKSTPKRSAKKASKKRSARKA